MNYRFEFDAPKSAINKDKHGIDFIEAQALWEQPVYEQPTRSDEEERLILTGIIDGKYWSAVVTYRGDVIRIISVRRARTDEIIRHEQENRLRS